MSEISKKMIGTFIADDTRPKPAVMAWLQAQCRTGSLRPFVDDFISIQDEILDVALLTVEQVAEHEILCRIPCRLFDHESAGSFASEVAFVLNPVTGEANRRMGLA